MSKLLRTIEPIDFAAAIVHGCHSRILLVTCHLTDSQGASAFNLAELARLGALVHTMNLTFVIVGDFNMMPDELVATQWIDQIRGRIVFPHETVSTSSNGGRMIDYPVISLVLAKNVELNVDLEALFVPHSSLCLELHMSISHVTMTTQLKPLAMSWKTEHDIKPEFANEIWSEIGSAKPFCARQQSPCSVLKASVVFQTFDAISSLLQPKFQNWLKRLSAYWNLRRDMQEPPDLSAAKATHWLEHTWCGRPRFRETSVTGRFFWRDAVISDSLARWWHTVSARLAECAAVRKSSHICAQLHLQNIFKILKKLHTSMPHATPKEMILGDFSDPDLEVSLIQQG